MKKVINKKKVIKILNITYAGTKFLWTGTYITCFWVKAHKLKTFVFLFITFFWYWFPNYKLINKQKRWHNKNIRLSYLIYSLMKFQYGLLET